MLQYINPNTRNVDPGEGLDKNLYVKAGDLVPIVDAINAMGGGSPYQGVIDCSSNPNYPIGYKNWYWKVSVAGNIGGGAGPAVEVGDDIICIADSPIAGTHAAVGANFMIIQKNMIPCTVAVLRTGTNDTDFVTANTLADQLNGGSSAFGTTNIITLSGGSASQIALTTTAAQAGMAINGTAKTTSDLSIITTINSASVNVVDVGFSFSAGLSGTEEVYGVYVNPTGLASNADTSAISAFYGKASAVASDRADYACYTANVASLRNTADTDQGLLVGFTGTMNNSSATSYGVRIAAQVGAPYTFTHTDGTWYGIHINHTAIVTAGTAKALMINMGLQADATITTRTIDVSTTSAATGAYLVNSVNVANTMTSASAVNMIEVGKYTLTSRVQTGNWANALVGKIDFSDTGYVTGLAGVVCAELDMPSTNPVGGSGTYACYEAEIGMPNAYTSTVPISFINANVWGIGGAAGVAYFDDHGSILSVSGLTSGAAKVFYDHDGTAGGDTVNGWLKVLVNGTPYYIGLYDSTH